MAALVVLSLSSEERLDRTGERISIFPGGATPTMFPAGTPFWIGYGFVPDPGSPAAEQDDLLRGETRFELDLDGESVPLSVDVQLEDGLPVGRTDLASFPTGLGAGWHEFVARWYDDGSLVLSSRTAIEFVEP